MEIEAGMNLHRFSGSTRACLHRASVHLSKVTSRDRLEAVRLSDRSGTAESRIHYSIYVRPKESAWEPHSKLVSQGRLNLAQDDSPGLDFKGRPVP
jgi:hypothetical protein